MAGDDDEDDDNSVAADEDDDDDNDDDSTYAPYDIDGEEGQPTKDETSDNNSDRLCSFCLHTKLANLLTKIFLFGIKRRQKILP